MMVACLTGWHIWTKRCKFVFQQHKLPSSEMLLNIWFEVVSWLRRRYDSIQGESDEEERIRQFFVCHVNVFSPFVQRKKSNNSSIILFFCYHSIVVFS